MCARAFSAAVAFALVSLCSKSALALPWDQDLFRQQSYQASEIARSPVPGTVPVRGHPFSLTLDEGEEQLTNPVAPSADSIGRGRRLYSANCVPCHGARGDGKGPVGPLVAAPNLLEEPYVKRGDGRIYTVVVMGGATMPRYGFKLSESERWDLVNYVRSLQGRVDAQE